MTHTTSQKSVFFAGATGLLGQNAGPLMTDRFRFIPAGLRRRVDHRDFVAIDLEDGPKTAELLRRLRPEVIVQAVAQTNVDACEENQARAYEVNVATTKNLTSWLAEESPGTHFVYISTDQVYDGPGEHVEDVVSPCNVYALTKLWAEDLARTLPRHLILRTNFFGLGTNGSMGLVAWLIDCLKQRRAVTLFGDVFFNPLYVKDLSEVICRSIELGLIGTYNVGAAAGGISKAEFALELAAMLGLEFFEAEIVSVDGTSLRARRPKDMRMSVARTEEALGLSLPTIQDGLKRLASDFKSRASVWLDES